MVEALEYRIVFNYSTHLIVLYKFLKTVIFVIRCFSFPQNLNEQTFT